MMKFPVDVYMIFASHGADIPSATIKLLRDGDVCENASLRLQLLWNATRFTAPTEFPNRRLAVSVDFEFLKIMKDHIQRMIDHAESLPDQYVNRTWTVEVSDAESVSDIEVYIRYMHVHAGTYSMSLESI